MSLLPTTLIAQTFRLTTSYTFTVKDQYNPVTARTITINPTAATKYFRFAACANGDATASAATTEEAAAEFLDHVQQRMNDSIAGPVWVLTLNDQGFSKVKYTGTGTGTVFVWDAGSIIRNLLGFTGSSISPALGTNAFVLSTYQPTHTIYLIGRDIDSPYKHKRQNVSASQTRGGRVSAWSSGSRPVFSAFDSVIHPTNQGYQSSLGIYSSPIDPDRNSRVVTEAAGTSPPWSVMDFLGTGFGHACGILPGTFQAEVAGTATVYDLSYLTPESREENVLVERNYIGHQKLQGLEFVVRTKGDSL